MLLLLHFCASWAPQCQQVDDVLEELHKDSSLAAAVKFLKVVYPVTRCMMTSHLYCTCEVMLLTDKCDAWH